MATYINKDGLPWNFGLDEAKPGRVAGYRTNGPKRVVEIVLDFDAAPAVAVNSVVIDYNCKLPKGAVISDVEILPASVDFTGTGTLNIGFANKNGVGGIDVDAFVVAATAAELNAGGVNLAGWVGAEVGGAPLAAAKVLTWEVDTAALAAGNTTILISYFIPKTEKDSLIWTKP